MAEVEPFAAVGGGAAACTVIGGRRCPEGRSLAAMLLKSRGRSVRIADSQPSVDVDNGDDRDRIVAAALSDGRALYVQIDVRDMSQVSRAIGGSDVVFLMDLVEAWEDFNTQYEVVVRGTKNVISACRECGVKMLIYNSSADVVFDGMHDIEDGDESLPYPQKFGDMFSDLKAQAEAVVLFANGKDGLLTCALRPCNPFGPRDVHLMRFLLAEARAQREKYIVGSDSAKCDFTHVDNIAHAHIMAEKALRSDGHFVAGKAFFISNFEHMKLMDFMSLTLQGLGYPRPKIILSSRHIKFIAFLIEWVQGKLRLHKNARSCFDPSIMRMFACTRTFDCTLAKKVIGYSPIVPLKVGMKSTFESFSRLGHLSSHMSERGFSEASKTEKLLGCGEVAEVLLWRNEKKTFSYLLGFFFLFNWFFLSRRTFVASMAKLLVLLNVILFVHGKLPPSIYGFTIGKISSSHFAISRSNVRNVVRCLASLWNGTINILRTIEQGADWSLFLKVWGYLLLFRFLSHFSLSTLVGAGIVVLFSSFIVYEQYEAEIDSSVTSAAEYLDTSKDNVVKHLPRPLVEYIEKLQI